MSEYESGRMRARVFFVPPHLAPNLPIGPEAALIGIDSLRAYNHNHSVSSHLLEAPLNSAWFGGAGPLPPNSQPAAPPKLSTSLWLLDTMCNRWNQEETPGKEAERGEWKYARERGRGWMERRREENEAGKATRKARGEATKTQNFARSRADVREIPERARPRRPAKP